MMAIIVSTVIQVILGWRQKSGPVNDGDHLSSLSLFFLFWVPLPPLFPLFCPATRGAVGLRTVARFLPCVGVGAVALVSSLFGVCLDPLVNKVGNTRG